MKNHYKSLKVSNYAEAGVIRTSYKKLAHRFHPDRSEDEAIKVTCPR